MFASIDEAVEYWKDELSYVDDAKVTGYVGGYPVVEFTINKAASLEWEPPVLRVCGYPEVINRILGKVM